MMNTTENIPYIEKAPFSTNPRSIITAVVIAFLTVVFLYFIKNYNYQLFHTFAELFRIVVALSIFLFTWNSRKLWDNGYLLCVGLAYPFIGFLDLMHLMTYEGMGLELTDNPINMSLQLYLMARFIESLAFFIPLFIGRHIPKPSYIMGGYAVVTCVSIITIMVWRIYPTFYIPDVGQTAIKQILQWVISGMFGVVIIFYIPKRHEFEAGIWIRIIMALAFTMTAELVYSLGLSLFDNSTVLNHFLSIISYYFIYRAIIVTGIEEPFNVVFHNLKRSENEKDLLVTDLRHALEEVKTLSGFIPICINCKKIRDDEGYWQQVEEYIRNRSNAEFSHAICPECMDTLYPDYMETSSSNNAKSSDKSPHQK